MSGQGQHTRGAPVAEVKVTTAAATTVDVAAVRADLAYPRCSMNTSTCRYYRSGQEDDLTIALHRESVRRGAGAPPYPVLERLDLTGLWLPVDEAAPGRDGFVALDGLEPIDVTQAAELYRRLGDMRLIPPTTPLPADLAEVAEVAEVGGQEEMRIDPAVGPWVLLPLLLSGTLLVVVTVLAVLVLAWALLG